MSISDKRKEYIYQYQREKLKRIPLDVPKDNYERIKAHSEAQGESVNGFIKRAISEAMEREKGNTSTKDSHFLVPCWLSPFCGQFCKNIYFDAIADKTIFHSRKNTNSSRSMEKLNKCFCDCFVKENGKAVCYGTREKDECSCGGNKAYCNFYPHVREKVDLYE